MFPVTVLFYETKCSFLNIFSWLSLVKLFVTRASPWVLWGRRIYFCSSGAILLFDVLTLLHTHCRLSECIHTHVCVAVCATYNVLNSWYRIEAHCKKEMSPFFYEQLSCSLGKGSLAPRSFTAEFQIGRKACDTVVFPNCNWKGKKKSHMRWKSDQT